MGVAGMLALLEEAVCWAESGLPMPAATAARIREAAARSRQILLPERARAPVSVH
jgi:hypothetical protein